MGSHLDTVPSGGLYDGAYGVAAAIGSMTSRMDALSKASIQTTERMNAKWPTWSLR